MNEAPFGEHEEWRPIPSLPAGYEASDLGRIRSWRHRKGTASSPLIRKPVKHAKYGHMSMMFYVDKKFVCRLVHHLVLDAFGIARLPNTETRHIDGIASNNRLDNLKWGTHVENSEDQVGHGTLTVGGKNGGAKLTNQQADEIRRSDESGVDAAKRCGVTPAVITRIRRGRGHVR